MRLLTAAPIRTRRDDPPQQFVHLDDLATAVATVAQTDESGVFNVAPDGWLTARQVRDLIGAAQQFGFRFRTRTPSRHVARRVGHQAPAACCYPLPMGIANDRIRAIGWAPRYGNDQVFVAADAGMPWDSMNAKQRQTVPLAIGTACISGLCLALSLWVRRILKRTKN